MGMTAQPGLIDNYLGIRRACSMRFAAATANLAQATWDTYFQQSDVSNGSVTDGHGFDLSDAGCTRALSFVAVSICAALTSRPRLALDEIAPLHLPAPRLGLRPRWPDYTSLLRPAKWGSGIRLHSSNPGPRTSALGQKRTFCAAVEVVIRLSLQRSRVAFAA